MSQVVGGPLGDHAGRHPWWHTTRVLLGATTVVLAAGMISKTACVLSGWGKDRQPFAQLCWTDLAGTSADAATPPHVTTWLERLATALEPHARASVFGPLGLYLSYDVGALGRWPAWALSLLALAGWELFWALGPRSARKTTAPQ